MHFFSAIFLYAHLYWQQYKYKKTQQILWTTPIPDVDAHQRSLWTGKGVTENMTRKQEEQQK
jgi:hypothetical protein